MDNQTRREEMDALEPIRVSAESEDIFCSARLLLLFSVINSVLGEKGISINRLGYYDFFSAQPFLVFSDYSSTKIDLVLKGFELTTVSYMSSSQRFSNRREKLKYYLSNLLIRALISVQNIDGEILYYITPKGKEIVRYFKSLYSLSYCQSAEIIVKKLSKLNDKKLDNEAKEWLKAKSFMMDLYEFSKAE
jgi:hypothetical protein